MIVVSKEEGVRGRSGLGIWPCRSPADDGKRFQAMDVVLGLLLGEKIKKGGSLREGGSKIGPDGRLSDLFLALF